MKVNSYNNRDISFNGIYNNKALKKGLEYAADNGATFGAATAITMATIVRPTSILLAPKTDKENKKYACAKSLASSTSGFLLTFLLTTPFSNSLKKIENNPEKYLKKNVIKKYKGNSEKLIESKSYSLATQLFKLGSGLLASVPKAFLTTMWIPIIMATLFKNNQSTNNNNNKKDIKNTNNISFKGKGLTKKIGEILNKDGMQKFAEKNKDSNFPMHIISLTDTLTTLTFIHQTNKSEKIDKARKNTLNYNVLISTSFSIASSYIIDKLLNKPTKIFIENFKKANKNDPKLEKYLEGIKIAKPILILGTVYYTLIPFVSTYLADRIPNTNTSKIIDKI